MLRLRYECKEKSAQQESTHGILVLSFTATVISGRRLSKIEAQMHSPAVPKIVVGYRMTHFKEPMMLGTFRAFIDSAIHKRISDSSGVESAATG